jgi:hypothetical protein
VSDLANKLLQEAELAAITKNVDIKNPLAGVKDALRTLIDDLVKLRHDATKGMADNEAVLGLALARTLVTDPVAKAIVADADEISAIRREIDEHLANAVARGRECRAHVALANAATAKMIEVVSKQIRAQVEKVEKEVVEHAKTPAGAGLRLQIHEPGLAVRTEVFNQDIVKVGKLPSSHLRVEDGGVSRMHAVIERVQHEGWYVLDLGSAAGTIVNDVKVNKALLMIGDVLLFGGVNVTVLA